MISEPVKKILDQVLEREGWPAYTEHPNDRGGPTKGGITIRTLESWRQRRCTRKELQRLDQKEAVAILFRRYVESNGIHRLEDAALKGQVVDNAILSGPMLAVKDLQRTVKVKADGIIGPVTLGAIKEASRGSETGATELANQVAITRAIRLADFVQHHPEQLVFLEGWMRRVLSFIR